MLDKKDQQLLVALQSHARMSVSELANTINLSDTPTLRRIKKLEQEHVITAITLPLTLSRSTLMCWFMLSCD